MSLSEAPVKSEKPKKFMFLRVGQSTFALPLTDVREVLGLGSLSPLPNMPAYFAGLINLRGKIISAVDLKISLNFSKSRSSSTDPLGKSVRRPCIVIANVGGSTFGAIVDDVLEVQAIPEDFIDRSPEGGNTGGVFEGLIKKENSPLAPILNLEKALRVKELLNATAKVAA